MMVVLAFNKFTFSRFIPAFLFLLFVAHRALLRSLNSDHLLIKTVFIILFVPLFLLSLFFLRLAFVPISRLHTTKTAIFHYVINVLLHFTGRSARFRLIEATKTVRKTQEKYLMDLLAENQDTEFGRRFGFANIKNRQQFREQIALTTYGDYSEYVERIEKGEQQLLTKVPVERLTVSSGTTGKVKHLPNTKYNLNAILNGFALQHMYRMNLGSKRPLGAQKFAEFSYLPKWRFAECGLPIGPVSAHPNNNVPSTVAVNRSTPLEAHGLMPEPAQTYIHWYYALYDRELRFFRASFAGTMVGAFDFLQKNWRLLADDIRKGKISNFKQEIPEDVLQKLKPLKADPVRAQEIERQLQLGFEGSVQRVWPNIEGVWCVATGSHSIFLPRLQYYTGSKVPILSCTYISSEGPIGVVMDAKQDASFTYTFVPDWCFFELIPEESMLEIKGETVPTFFLDELEIGKRYEIVVTTFNGFYRYRLGDVVKIVDFFNETPVMEFCSRTGSILDVRSEKTTEDMVLQALERTKWPNQGQVVDFTSTDCLSLANACPDSFEQEGGLFYVFFLEIDGVSRAVNDKDETAAFDAALSDASYPFKSFRAKDAIQMPKIFTVRSGTFDALKQWIIERNATVSNQYKTPHYTKSGDILRFMIERCYK